MRALFRLILLILTLVVGYLGWQRQATPSPDVLSRSSQVCYTVEGYNGCGYFNRAASVAKKLEALGQNFVVRPFWGDLANLAKVQVKGHSRAEFVSARLEELNRIRGAGGHRTSPFVYRGCGEVDKEYVGGAVDFLQEIENKHQNAWQKVRD